MKSTEGDVVTAEITPAHDGSQAVCSGFIVSVTYLLSMSFASSSGTLHNPSCPEQGIGSGSGVTLSSDHPTGPCHQISSIGFSITPVILIEPAITPRGRSSGTAKPRRRSQTTPLSSRLWPAWSAITVPIAHSGGFLERFSIRLPAWRIAQAHGCFTVSARIYYSRSVFCIMHYTCFVCEIPLVYFSMPQTSFICRWTAELEQRTGMS